MDLTDRELTEAIGEFRLRFPHCPKPAVLQAAQAGVLPAAVRELVRAHMGTCVACAALAEDLSKLDEEPLQSQAERRIRGRIRSGIAAEESARRKAAPRSSWWAPAAIFAAAVILLMVGVRLMEQTPAPTQIAAVAQPASTAFRLDKPAVMLPASALLVWRGDAANVQGELREALIPYEADQYTEAASRLARLTKKYPGLAEAYFYLGISQLFLTHNDEAAASLKTARGLAPATLAEDADWYLALAYQRTGRGGDARPLLEKLCHDGGKNSVKACSGRKELPVVQ